MNRTHTNQYQITTCTACRHRDSGHCPGLQMLTQLSASIDKAGPLIDDSFEISGTVAVPSCDRPCRVAYHGSRDSAMLFGDVDPTDDIADLMAYARGFADSRAGWSGQAPVGADPAEYGLARLPSAIIVIQSETATPC